MSTSPKMTFHAAMSFIAKTALVLTAVISPVRAQVAPYDAYTWTDSHATFYGGDDASGTMGGACGYGNLYQTGYGVNSAALSGTLFNNGLSCGACFELQCIKDQSRWCYADAGPIMVTATNLCPANWDRPVDGWCNPPRTHFDLAYPMFATLAQKVGGIIPVQYRRVSCVKQGGVRFLLQGNPWFNLVLVYNVAGAGNVVLLEMRGSGSQFVVMTHNWGQNWELKQKLQGQPLSFRVTLSTGEQLVSTNVAPANWQFGQTFEDTHNF